MPAELASRFETALPQELLRSGFQLLDQRQVDMKLSERPELIACQRESCLRDQAQLVGVQRLIQPRLRRMRDGVGVTLTLFDVHADDTGGPGVIERLAEAATVCRACQADQIRAAVSEAATQLGRSLYKAQEAQLEVVATPPGARLSVDSAEVGVGRAQVALPPGEHVVVAQGPGGRAEQRVTLGPRGRVRVELTLLPVPASVGPPLVAAAPRTAVRPLAVSKWALAGIGVAALIAGTALWALDGTAPCDRAPGQLRCPEVLDTAPLGIGLFAGGAAALGTSAVLFGIDYRRSRESGTVAALQIGGRF